MKRPKFILIRAAALLLAVLSFTALVSCGTQQTAAPEDETPESPVSIVMFEPPTFLRPHVNSENGETDATPVEPTPSVPTSDETTVTPVPEDHTPPVVTGENFTVTSGGSVSYKKQITATDDSGLPVTIDVDASAVDLDTPGDYPVVYTVRDAAGNETRLTLTVTVVPAEPDPNDMEAVVKYNVYMILGEIVDDSMNDMQKAYAVYYWTRHNINYTGTSDKSSPIVGAYDGLMTRKGDCYTYFAVAKAFLDALHIETIDVIKLKTSPKQYMHYWLLINIGTGWYHFDANPYVKIGHANFFMATDAEIKKWDNTYYHHAHNYDASLYPEFATESVQYLIDYDKPTLTLPENFVLKTE